MILTTKRVYQQNNIYWNTQIAKTIFLCFYDRAVFQESTKKKACLIMALRLVMEYIHALYGLQDNPVSGSAYSQRRTLTCPPYAICGFNTRLLMRHYFAVCAVMSLSLF